LDSTTFSSAASTLSADDEQLTKSDPAITNEAKLIFIDFSITICLCVTVLLLRNKDDPQTRKDTYTNALKSCKKTANYTTYSQLSLDSFDILLSCDFEEIKNPKKQSPLFFVLFKLY
jgi:hypothetical protein